MRVIKPNVPAPIGLLLGKVIKIQSDIVRKQFSWKDNSISMSGSACWLQVVVILIAVLCHGPFRHTLIEGLN